MDGTVAIVPDSAKEITELTSVGQDRNPWISSDGMTMYFSRDLGVPNHSDIYIAKRSSPTGAFDSGTLVTNFSAPSEEDRVWLTSDQLTIVMSTNHQVPSNQLEIHMDVRQPTSMGFATPTPAHLDAVNSPGSERIDPWLSDDGLHLYWAADTNNTKLQIRMSTRATATGDFGTPSVVGGFPPAQNVSWADPTLYQNERLILFSTSAPGGGVGDLWYAHRASATADFEGMVKIPVDSDIENEFDPALSADGCDLYYASDHGHTFLHLFHAKIAN